MRGDIIIALILLLGMAGSWLFGYGGEGAPSPEACVLWFCGGCMALVLLLFLLLRLRELAEKLVAPAGDGGAAADAWRLLAIALPLLMVGGLLCKEFGSLEALGWWIKGVLGFSALLLVVFLVLLALASLRRRCR